MRGATVESKRQEYWTRVLQSTPHMRGATIDPSKSASARADFNPRPTCVGRRFLWVVASQSRADFNPRPTCVGRQFAETKSPVVLRLQSTPHLRGATVSLPASMLSNIRLQSTPHMRGATRRLYGRRPWCFHFNPRPTCVGRRPNIATHDDLGKLQSTPHIRGATNDRKPCVGLRHRLQSTPHMRGATAPKEYNFVAQGTSIHAPHAWGDICKEGA